VLAVDINRVQLAYAQRRFAGAPAGRGSAERVMAFGRALAPLVGWRQDQTRAFFELEDPAEQIAFWRRHLDTWRFRVAFDALFSAAMLRLAYASRFLHFLPRRLGPIMRRRMERCFARHPNRTNPYARALFLGELCNQPVPPEASKVRLCHSDAAAWLEGEPPRSFDAFTLSNILDGADRAYRRRLLAAVRRTAAPGAVVVLRSFAEPSLALATNRAAEDRSLLWGIVDVRPAKTLGQDE